jgi:hypothetical protein
MRPAALIARAATIASVAVFLLLAATPTDIQAGERFEGQFYAGEGDVELLQLLDISRRSFAPDPEFQNLPMLYTPAWNGLVEGPTWGAWWIQNSYGTTYCVLPFLEEPMVSFLGNSHALWFDQMGDGKQVFTWRDQHWVIPDGQLCDAAAPGLFIAKQGDGNVAIHDWGVEFTAAGLLMQAELLLVSRDRAALDHYLPKLRRCADFLDSRRDPANNLLLAGAAGNLLAPSYAGWKKPDGTYDKAYLAGLSITYIAALDRLIELEKLAGNQESADRYRARRDLARQGLPKLMTDEGYFIKYLDPDGTRHGVYGEKQHGYFEAVANHDAVCFRVADDAQAEKIYRKIASIPGLRPHGLIVTNCPGLDDMYNPPDNWLWQFGTWVNGGHWSTCEARMIMGYYRLGKYDDIRRSIEQMMTFARAFRMDNPLVDFGAAVYQPKEPINLCYDSFGPAAAMVRGLYEYLYGADALTLVPHVPPQITRLEQHFPIRFGTKRLYLASVGTGPVRSVSINGQPWSRFDEKSITLPYDQTPEEAVVQITLGDAKPVAFVPRKPADLASAAPELAKAPRMPEQPGLIAVNDLPLRIGADSQGENRFVGDIGRAQVFARALSADEVAVLAGRKPSELDRDQALVGDWRFDRGEQKVYPNEQGEALPANTVGEIQAATTPEGRAIHLSGSGYLEIKPDAKLNLTTACTLAAWIRPSKQPAGGGRILDKSRAGTDNGYLLDTCPGNSLRLIVARGSLSHDAQLAPDRWVHVAGTAAADGTLALYLDGRQVATTRHDSSSTLAGLDGRVRRALRFHELLKAAGLADSYEAAHARLVVDCASATARRAALLAEGKLARLPGPTQAAADQSYLDTTAKLCDGLAHTLESYRNSSDAGKQQVFKLWEAAGKSGD